jgi:ketosteroid isomerase-like protein
LVIGSNSQRSSLSLEENKRLARLYFETMQAGNLDVFDEIMADDFIVHAIHGKYSIVINADDDERGPASFKKFAVEWRETYPDGQVTLDEVVAEGDRIIMLWTFNGTQRGAKFIWIGCNDLTTI